MSKILFTDTITLYNHRKVAGEDTWYRTVIDGVQWRQKTINAVTPDGKLSLHDIVSITIPMRDGYLPATTWLGKKIDGTWTINPESNMDIVVLGVCEKLLSMQYRIKDLKREIPDVATITGFFNNTNRGHLKHWRITANAKAK